MNLIKLAQKEKRIILTHDKDFESLVANPKYQAGIIAIRLKIQNAKHHWHKLNKLLSAGGETVLNKSITIITEKFTHSIPYKE